MVGFVRKKTVIYTRSAKKTRGVSGKKLMRQVFKRWGIREVTGGGGGGEKERGRGHDGKLGRGGRTGKIEKIGK